jgi:plastocyanin
MPKYLLPLLGAGLLILAGAARADTPSFALNIQNQSFVPQDVAVPAGTKVQFVISNQDDLPAEFESYDLSREVVVPAHGQVKVYIGPLDPGRYRFFNDFHQSSEGWVVVGEAGKK